jgi:hypothetical protein
MQQQVTGERVVLCNCADPAREDEFNAWYDAYAVDILWPRLLVNVRRYRLIEATADADSPRYMALYDIASDDLPQAWPLTRDHPTRPRRERSALLDTRLAATFQRMAHRGTIGSDRADVIALFVDPSRAGDAERELDLLVEELLDTGACHGAWRLVNVEEDRSQPQLMQVLELADAGREPAGTGTRTTLALMQARLSQSHCTIRYLAAYRPIFSSGY